LKNLPSYIFYVSILILSGCGDDSVSEKTVPNEDTTDSKDLSSSDELISTTTPNLEFPKVRVEELDHSQEFFKEQHTTSFSYVPRKNWTSFTASKSGILTKVLLYGKANLLDSPHYGLSMSGFVRAGNPDSGPKYGSWILTREDIVSQLASQGLGEREAGWLTIRMLGQIPQKVGTRYFLVCDKITENKAWFGEFAFAEANPYEFGSHWLNKDHDLVMRTYVGKTDEQIKALQVEPTKNVVPKSDESLPSPVSQNPSRTIIAPPTITPQPPAKPEVTVPTPPVVIEKVDSNDTLVEVKEDNRTQKKSLFDRLFKKDKNK
jgi:hypothetical protein